VARLTFIPKDDKTQQREEEKKLHGRERWEGDREDGVREIITKIKCTKEVRLL